jgi:4-amino-4-deoxy-L-arabinose transferase-like glycosyltransferase
MKRWLIVLLILAVATFFRFYDIGSTPPGLYPDEAINGNDAVQALETAPLTGGFKVFYPENNGREGLFINLQALSVAAFGNHIWALRIVSAIAGVLTVLGLYFLTKQLFNWQIASISSFLLAISFWHVNFSRIAFSAVSVPLALVWGLYFFWRGLASSQIRSFIIGGFFWGLGLHTYIAFRAMPLIFIFALLAYWRAIKKDFDHEKYEHTRNEIIRGLAAFLVIAILVALPIGYYFYAHPQDFWGRTNQLSIFSSPDVSGILGKNIVQTLGMFNFVGDFNWRHNISGQPMLIWPVGALFVLGFIKSCIKLFKPRREHGHFSAVQALLLSWFFVGLLPAVLSNEGLPQSLRAIAVVPVIFIFAGEGLWWIIDKIGDWYRERDVHEFSIRRRWMKESSVMATFALVILLISFTFIEYDKYFNKWAKNPNTALAFNQNYVDIGNQLNAMPQKIKKYVLVNAPGVLVNGTPMPAQTVMFITDTYTPEKQKAKNIYYLTEEQFKKRQYDRNSVVVPLE